jgi:hypothetical protein
MIAVTQLIANKININFGVKNVRKTHMPINCAMFPSFFCQPNNGIAACLHCLLSTGETCSMRICSFTGVLRTFRKCSATSLLLTGGAIAVLFASCTIRSLLDVRHTLSMGLRVTIVA